MRIIAGRLGGRMFDAPRGDRTHPMGDKIRGALFNILGDIEDMSVLDAFAGSGGLCFEAASRGASRCVAIDNDRAAATAIRQNISRLGLENKVTFIAASANAWHQTNLLAKFDLVFCDPPYNDLQPNLLARLASHTKPDGIFVLSWPGGMPPPSLTAMNLVEARSYGDAQLLFLRPTTP